jgi:hypothetical protein
MAERTRWHLIPRTAPLCWFSMAAGVLLLVLSVVTLSTTGARVPVFQVIAVVAAAALIAIATLGLVKPQLRGR